MNLPTKYFLVTTLALAGLFLGGCTYGPGGGVGVYASSYPSYRGYYRDYGYSGAPFYGYPRAYGTSIVVSGRNYSRGYGRHHYRGHRRNYGTRSWRGPRYR